MKTNLTMPVKGWGKEHLQVLDAGDPSESLTRNSLNLILAQVPGEKEMRKRKREILGFVWSHFTFRVLRKMDGSPQLWSLRPNCSTDHKCHILLYSSGLLSLCLCVRLMKNISKAVLCNERSHSGASHNPAENAEKIKCTLSNPRKKTDKSGSTSKWMPGIFNARLWAKWF